MRTELLYQCLLTAIQHIQNMHFIHVYMRTISSYSSNVSSYRAVDSKS